MKPTINEIVDKIESQYTHKSLQYIWFKIGDYEGDCQINSIINDNEASYIKELALTVFDIDGHVVAYDVEQIREILNDNLEYKHSEGEKIKLTQKQL